MSQVVQLPRPFSVRARHVDGHHARTVQEASFEAAAIAYVEDFPLVGEAEDHQMSVIVRDLTDGREHCFRVDLDSGDTTPCA